MYGQILSFGVIGWASSKRFRSDPSHCDGLTGSPQICSSVNGSFIILCSMFDILISIPRKRPFITVALINICIRKNRCGGDINVMVTGKTPGVVHAIYPGSGDRLALSHHGPLAGVLSRLRAGPGLAFRPIVAFETQLRHSMMKRL